MKFQLHACSPLLVRHLKQIDLGDRPRDVQESIDPAEAIKGRLNECFGRFDLAQIKIADLRLRCCILYGIRYFR